VFYISDIRGFKSLVLGGMTANTMRITKHKKGVLDQLSPLVVGLVAVGITIVVGLLIMAEVALNSKVVANANASTAVDETQDAMSDVPTWLPIIVITVIGALLIGLISLFRRR